jgi:hypothetical protein
MFAIGKVPANRHIASCEETGETIIIYVAYDGLFQYELVN